MWSTPRRARSARVRSRAPRDRAVVRGRRDVHGRHTCRSPNSHTLGDSAIEFDARVRTGAARSAQYQCARTGARRAPALGRGGAAAVRPGGVNWRSANAIDRVPAARGCAGGPRWWSRRTRRRRARRLRRRGRRRPPRSRGASRRTDAAIAFVQNFNVALRSVGALAVRRRHGVGGSGGRPDFTLLTYDGSEGDAYQLMSIRWSPDSKKLVAYRRRPGYNRLVHYVLLVAGRPAAAEGHVDLLSQARRRARLRAAGRCSTSTRGSARSSTTRCSRTHTRSLKPLWRKDSHAFTFEYNQRGHQVYRIIEVDAATGTARAVVVATSRRRSSRTGR